MADPIHGTVHGKAIELHERLALPDGTQVLLTVEPLPLSDEERREGALAMCGAWNDDPSIPDVCEAIGRERHRQSEREVRIDCSSWIPTSSSPSSTAMPRSLNAWLLTGLKVPSPLSSPPSCTLVPLRLAELRNISPNWNNRGGSSRFSPSTSLQPVASAN